MISMKGHHQIYGCTILVKNLLSSSCVVLIILLCGITATVSGEDYRNKGNIGRFSVQGLVVISPRFISSHSVVIYGGPRSDAPNGFSTLYPNGTWFNEPKGSSWNKLLMT